jgi:predicted nucleotide-binding protein (sugar kinase/HSP70/actin superfamily)
MKAITHALIYTTLKINLNSKILIKYHDFYNKLIKEYIEKHRIITQLFNINKKFILFFIYIKNLKKA